MTLDDIRHPLIREALRMHDVRPPIEVVSMADVPAGTGLGSSGAFTVGLLRAVHAFQRKYVDPAVVAEEACKIEIEILQEPVGKQDQYIAAFGGLACFEFCRRRAGQRRAAQHQQQHALQSRRSSHDVLHRLLAQCLGRAGRPKGPVRTRRQRDARKPAFHQAAWPMHQAGAGAGQHAALRRADA